MLSREKLEGIWLRAATAAMQGLIGKNASKIVVEQSFIAADEFVKQYKKRAENQTVEPILEEDVEEVPIVEGTDIDEEELEEDEEKNENLANYDKLLDILSGPEFDNNAAIDTLFEWVYEKRHREMLYGKDECISKEELSAVIIAAQHFKKTGDMNLYHTLMNLYDRKYER